MQEKVRNQNILITGASSGIGKSLALYYAQNGAKNIFISGRNEKRTMETLEECKAFCKNTFATIIDVTNREEMYQWVHNCNKKANLDLVFANAGVGKIDDSIDATYETFDININGVLNTVLPTLEAYKSLENKQKNKTIAIVSSIAGYHGLSTCPDYSATKACVKAWGEALRVKLKPENIQVNIICPGFVRSRITDKNTCTMPGFMEAEEAVKIIAKRIEKNCPIIAFPWYLRFSTWLISILPNCISDYIYAKLPNKA